MVDDSKSRLYRECGKMATKSRSSKAHIALVQLEDYVNGTIIQTIRVHNVKEASIFGKETQAKILQTVGKDAKERKKEMEKIVNNHDLYLEYLQLYLEMHFLLICIDKVRKLVSYIAKEDGDSKLDDLWNRVKPQFELFAEARHYFEHIRERIEYKIDDLGLSGTDGQILQFRDKKGKWQTIMVDDTGLKLVRDTYDSLLAILRSRPNRNTK